MFKSLVGLDPEKIPSQARFEPGIFRSRGGRLNHKDKTSDTEIQVQIYILRDTGRDTKTNFRHRYTGINTYWEIRVETQRQTSDTETRV